MRGGRTLASHASGLGPLAAYQGRAEPNGRIGADIADVTTYRGAMAHVATPVSVVTTADGSGKAPGRSARFPSSRRSSCSASTGPAGRMR
jgi:hypothetical protein